MDIDASVEIPSEFAITLKLTMKLAEWQALRDNIQSISQSGVEIGQFYAAITQAVANATKQG